MKDNRQGISLNAEHSFGKFNINGGIGFFTEIDTSNASISYSLSSLTVMYKRFIQGILFYTQTMLPFPERIVLQRNMQHLHLIVLEVFGQMEMLIQLIIK